MNKVIAASKKHICFTFGVNNNISGEALITNSSKIRFPQFIVNDLNPNVRVTIDESRHMMYFDNSKTAIYVYHWLRYTACSQIEKEAEITKTTDIHPNQIQD